MLPIYPLVWQLYIPTVNSGTIKGKDITLYTRPILMVQKHLHQPWSEVKRFSLHKYSSWFGWFPHSSSVMRHTLVVNKNCVNYIMYQTSQYKQHLTKAWNILAVNSTPFGWSHTPRIRHHDSLTTDAWNDWSPLGFMTSHDPHSHTILSFVIMGGRATACR